METVILVILVAAAMIFGLKCLNPQQKPGKKCQSCPEFKRCGGGRPRCPRRSEQV